MDFERIFDESYSRVLDETRNGERFIECFYRRFVAADPKIAELFRHSDMARQTQLVEKSFYHMVEFSATNYADDYLERVAIRHNRCDLDIKPEYYDLWLTTLIGTVADFDPLFDDNIELAWRLVLSTGLTYMKFKYDH